jgi:hypothetical protein
VPKELTHRDCGSEKKLAAACRKVYNHARVVWRKTNFLSKTGTQRNCGPWSKLTAATIKMTCMQEWHGLGKTLSERNGPGTRQNKKPRNDERTGKDGGKPKMQKRLKGPRAETAAMRQNEN